MSHAAGPAETLRLVDVPDPVAGPGEVVIDVAACAVNFPDVLLIEDRYQHRPPRPFAPGIEVAGTVSATGPGVVGLNVGTRVLALVDVGGMAERCVAAVSQTFEIPDVMPFDQAAALCVTYGTSLHALDDRALLRSGETVLVLGAASGVGLAAIEIAKSRGARVVAAASSAERVAVAREHGADVGVIYPRGPFDAQESRALAALFKDACGPRGWDVAYDPIGGDYAEAAVRAAGWESRYLVVGFVAGIPRLPLNLVLLKACSIVGVLWGAAIRREPQRLHRQFQSLIEMYLSGAIRPHVSAHVPLSRGAEAIASLANRQALGKVVVIRD